MVAGLQGEPVVSEPEAHRRAVGQCDLVGSYAQIPRRCFTGRVFEFDLLTGGGDGVAVQLGAEPVDGVADLGRMRCEDECGEVGELGIE
jgi:hypothetical protein